MEEIKHPKGKIYYTMGEVAEMFDVRPSLLRYWEQEFDILKPHRNKKGNRLFTPQDVDNLRIIYHLLKEKKMKIEVARKHLGENKDEADRDAEIVEKLMSIRSMLVQIKQDMLHGAAEDGDDFEEDIEAPAPQVKKPAKTGAASSDDTKKGAPPRAEGEPEITEEFVVEGEVLTVSDVIRDEQENGEKPPFKEQMLFEVVSDRETIDVDVMIDSFIAKNYDEEADDERPAVDPFSVLAGTEADPVREKETPRPSVIEQTLF